MDTLAVRHQVASLTTLFKLQSATGPPSLVALRPAQATLSGVAPTTHLQLAAGHQHKLQLQTALPARSCNVALRSFPESALEEWNKLPPSILSHALFHNGMQQFMVNTTIFNDLPGLRRRTLPHS